MASKGKKKKEFVSKTKKGLEPGSLVYNGYNDPGATTVLCYKIYKSGVETIGKISSKDMLPENSGDWVLWVRAAGLADIGFIREIGEAYGIEKITLEDVLDTSHSPKFESFDNYFFIILKKLLYIAGSQDISADQVSMVLMSGVLITFEEKPAEELDIVLARTRRNPEIFFSRGAAYAAYAIMDTIVDDYLGVLDKIIFDIEELEDLMGSMNSPVNTDALFAIKRRLNFLYRNTRITDEIVGKLIKALNFDGESRVSLAYLKDLADHAVKLRDIIINSREAIKAIYDENISRMQLQTSYFINILTVVNVLLWPFMIISGIFGMNFSYIPFTSFKGGVFITVAVMCAISAILLVFFKKKNFF